MLFNSIEYLFFLPLVVIIYYVIPLKIRNFWLLLASYYFYMSWNAKYGLLLLITTLSTYISAVVIEKLSEEKLITQRIIMTICMVFNFGLLIYFKYINFLIETINHIYAKINVCNSFSALEIILPVGISFFVFQATGYLIDVYRKNTNAELNIVNYALFISFFPQLVAGPIERSGNLLKQIKSKIYFDVSKIKDGLLTLAYGLFLKIVIADNIASTIDPVFANPTDFSGMTILFSVIMFGFQIYADFNGYTKMAIGSAGILGFRLNENFDTPYLAESIKEFWRRWHISLTSWFREYLYIPLGGSKKGKMRKQVNTMIVYLVSGLWHGAAWNYVMWGGINGFYNILEDVTCNFRKTCCLWLKIDSNSIGLKILKRIIVFIMVDFAWLFFRAEKISDIKLMLIKIINEFRLSWILHFEWAECFQTRYTLTITIFAILMLVATDIAKYYKVDLKGIIFKQQILIRWIIYFIIFLLIIYWGYYGNEYEKATFIYFQF